jgi:DNA-binding transcriptional LysR family regulator
MAAMASPLLTLGDPLFVRAGRGIAPTDRAVALREPFQAVLDSLKALTDKRPFDPSIGQFEYTIAANDFQRELIFPGLVRALASEEVDALFRFIPAGIPATDLLRHGRCQLIVTPFPPAGPDIYQSRLFDDHMVCFFDSGERSAPVSRDEYCAADYIEIRFSDDETAIKALYKSVGLVLKKPRLSALNFSALSAFLRGSDLISAQLSLMGRVELQGFASAPLPFETSTLTMYMAWHRRDHLDPAHQWLRKRIKASVDQML